MRARRAKGWSQEELAEHSGLSLRTIQRIEKGKVQARLHSLRVLSETLGLDLTALNKGGGDTTELTTDDWVRLRQLNFSALVGLPIPFVNIGLPLWLWRRATLGPAADRVARRIISVQLLWTAAVLLLLLASPAISYQLTGQVSVGRVPLFWWVYLGAAVLQIILVLRLATGIAQKATQKLLAWPNFL